MVCHIVSSFVYVSRLLLVLVVQGSPSLTSTMTIDVTVKDINDNQPRFTQLFRASVYENASPGTVVLQVTSTNADDVGVTRYSLKPSPGPDLFAIDPDAGTITVAGPIDRESTDDVLDVRVVANDGAFRAETTVTIDVLDENDVAPVCHLPASFNAIQTTEDARLSVVVNVSATDADSTSPSRDAVISLTGAWSRDFVVVDGGRALAWRRPVPFQTTLAGAGGRSSPLNAHRVRLAAVDAGRPSLWTECPPLTVTVLAENAFSPQFADSYYSVAVPNNASVGFNVMTLRATCVSSPSSAQRFVDWRK